MTERKLTRKQHVDYWIKESSENIKDMNGSIKSDRKINALICGHLVVEKMLKALSAARDVQIRKEHRLWIIAEQNGLWHTLTESQKNDLMEITRFFSSRYPDYRRRFYNLCKSRDNKGKYTYFNNCIKKLNGGIVI